ncbi:MAG: hypothetical protein DHS20C18_21900 [Saprospiraceae bacterium]|nr:MAG: hypothetical protein DHS20C18_21900 [Saprospiraceae bacterium]
MTALLVILCLILIAIVAVQIGKVTELASKIRGEEEVEKITNNRQANLSMIFMVLFLVGCVWSAAHYRNYMLGFGPHEAASAHGGVLDYMFDITLFFTAIVFFITQILLFYFAYKYKAEKGRKALYMPHDNKLEVVWTVIPAVVMTFLVVGGLDAWNEVMADIPEGAKSVLSPTSEDEYLEVEAMGYQFAWNLRYPGEDGLLGTRDFRKITGNNVVGQDWTDEKNIDDFHPNELVLPVNQNIRIRILARDVLHNFDLPHFRVKMDAVPGMPTYFVFKPILTTEQYRQQLKGVPEYEVPDPNQPDKKLWETFNYELACAELCGKGHFSMRRLVKIVTQEEYEAWLKEQQSLYMSSIRGTDDDPRKDELLGIEIKQRKEDFNTKVETALASDTIADKVLRFDYVTFETGSANLTKLSHYELDNLVEALNKYPSMTLEVAGHTDNTGTPEANQLLSESRAQAVYNYLVQNGIDVERLTAVGYGQTKPVDSNDTEAGREKNRRTEFKILTQ